MMIARSSLTMVALAIAALAAPADAQTTMTFDDEFNQGKLGPKWQMGYSWAPDGYKVGPSFWPGANSSGISPAQFNNKGTMSLVVASDQSNTHGQSYLAGIVTTKNSFSQIYGYFEARLRMPQTPGLMGAFWLLPVNGDWPPEIDITEVLANQPTTNFTTLHTTGGQGASVHLAKPETASVPNTGTDFHVYAVDWQKDYIAWYFDDREVHREATPPDLHQPAYILLDSLAGNPGDWEGGPSSPHVLDAMEVDYVRVSQTKPPSGFKISTPVASTMTVPSAMERPNRAKATSPQSVMTAPEGNSLTAQHAPTQKDVDASAPTIRVISAKQPATPSVPSGTALEPVTNADTSVPSVDEPDPAFEATKQRADALLARSSKAIELARRALGE